MNINLNIKTFYTKLRNFFKNDISFYVKTHNRLFVVTKLYDFYEIDCEIEKIRSLNNKDETLNLKSMKKTKLCGKKVVDISYGYKHWIARTVDGKVYTWGDNECGQLGYADKSIPQPESPAGPKTQAEPEMIETLKNLKVINIKCGAFHSLALTKRGQIYAWGLNNHGQLGIGSDSMFEIEPSIIDSSITCEVVMISCGKWHSLALTACGLVYGWGNNQFGQSGFEIELNKTYKPVLITNLNMEIVRISCGETHSLSLAKDGSVYFFGKIGKENKDLQEFPHKLNHELKFSEIASHFNKSISVSCTIEGEYYVWGHCGNDIFLKPQKTKCNSFNEIFNLYYGMHLEHSKELMNFFEPTFRNGHYSQEFRQVDLLGKGGFGEVFLSYEIKKKKFCAVKKVVLEQGKKNILSEHENYLYIFKLYKNDYLIEYFDAWFEESIVRKDHLINIFYIKMELCDNTLKEAIDQIQNSSYLKESGVLNTAGYFIASQLCLELLDSINFLHQHVPPIIHLDINPNNILLKRSSINCHSVILSDFGNISTQDFKDKIHQYKGGTVGYMAPEVIYKVTKYDTSADMYSFGEIMKEILSLNVIR
jgi:alpha-tubulin suppressor-like RCC1 family protein